MICLFARRRLGAYLDGALDAGPSRALAYHVESCRSCRHEVDSLRRMKTLLRQALPHSAEPEDWSGFWPGIVRGIQDRTERGGRPVPARWSYRWTRRRWALSGVAAAAVAVLSFVVGYETWPVSGPPEDPVVITAANSQYPGGAMVYSAPEKLAVVWVFDE